MLGVPGLAGITYAASADQSPHMTALHARALA
jgi:hypothetical protein